jgi:threonine dehydrogenase-like Zn-dependent dehydrogenase
MRAVTFQAPGVVRIEERPVPEPVALDDAVVRIEATGVCGSDLHVYRGRIQIEPGFTIGHEYVGTVVAAGDGVTRAAVGDRVAGCFQTACGTCARCMHGEYQRCVESRTFGLGAALGSLQGTQAEFALVPRANLVLRRVPAGMSDEVALFAGDVMGTGYHGVSAGGVKAGDVVAKGRGGVDVTIDAVGHPDALETAIRVTRDCGTVQCIGIYAERAEVHLGLAWLKSLTIRGGQANVIAHIDQVLSMLSQGQLDPSALVTHHMSLDDAAQAYELFDHREALKIILRP